MNRILFSCLIGDLSVGIYRYWIGVSFRQPGCHYALDLGFIKFIWRK